jgi:hypothetical protein
MENEINTYNKKTVQVLFTPGVNEGMNIRLGYKLHPWGKLTLINLPL